MRNLGIIKLVEKTTSWISSFVIMDDEHIKQKKKQRMGHDDVQHVHAYTTKKLHICLDPSNLNKAAIWEPYCYRILDDVITLLSNARYFTIFSLMKGYSHYEVDDESSNLKTFQTPIGRFRFKCLPMGSNFAVDTFQCRPNEAYSGLTGPTGIIGDMIVFGKCSNEHYINVTKFCQWSHQYGIKCGHERIQYRHTQVIFYNREFNIKVTSPQLCWLRMWRTCLFHRQSNNYSPSEALSTTSTGTHLTLLKWLVAYVI